MQEIGHQDGDEQENSQDITAQREDKGKEEWKARLRENTQQTQTLAGEPCFNGSNRGRYEEARKGILARKTGEQRLCHVTNRGWDGERGRSTRWKERGPSDCATVCRKHVVVPYGGYRRRKILCTAIEVCMCVFAASDSCVGLALLVLRGAATLFHVVDRCGLQLGKNTLKE